ncbi:Thioesterase/thiol ester dehydrase-isomerase [Dichomitus squalens LYAD-421 SS1]|uniref:Thioesterase/thiol ester dehydrase-isomerase n=1 Tax=Dichomitus squalens (strain LYAD-421) TaxID=732165 RepID=UPI0004414D91|nr:Thioesterase/thiol ester dehydrase-isomerase [Dichomitus squalens LYAD-421 SS1]EJF64420.1 Thioesterase/thiol ester dehydrase-isomerase [Dichomitus squalens LYAD-421 SS1]
MYCSAINGLLRPGWRTGRDAALQIARSRIALPCARYSSFTIETLQKKFRDPSSPYHIAPGTQGPDSPDPPVEEPLSPEEEGRTKLAELGYDPESFWEQKVVWGDHDAFQHVNNVRYLRFLESGRIHWMHALGHELGGPAKAEQMTRGQGVSLILKSISIDYKAPVTFPDTLLVAHKPHPGPAARNREPGTPARPAKTHFFMAGAIWSYAQRRIVTESDSVLVWYDYDRLTKCDPGEEVKAAIQRRMNLRSGEGTH